MENPNLDNFWETQKFVYPPAPNLISNSIKREFQYSLCEFDTVTVENDEIRKMRRQARYFLEDLGNGVILEMVYISGGSFMMGSTDEEEDRDICESPQHWVNVPSFYIGKFSVTQAQWQAVMQNNLSLHKGSNFPVENVSWYDSVEFCKRLSLMTGRTYRLPSEAEWEYACRAGTTTSFNFGENITTKLANYWNMNESDINEQKSNEEETSQEEPEGCVIAYRPDTVEYLQTKGVGSYFPNAFGLYDMHGNVFELCQDAWHSNYNGAPTDGSAWGSGEDTSLVVIRGGSFDYYDHKCRSAYRSETGLNYRYHGTGFRVACSFD